MEAGYFKYIEQILKEYPDMDRYISLRIEELTYPTRVEEDENIGGSSSGFVGRPTERMAMTIMEDKRLATIEENKRAVAEALSDSDPLTVKIIRMYYFEKPRLKTWDGVALATCTSEGHCRRLRTKFFKRVADELGLPI